MTDYLRAASLFAAHRYAPAAEYRDVRRSVLCVCGAGAVAPSLAAALERIERHLETGTTACDHAVSIVNLATTYGETK